MSARRRRLTPTGASWLRGLHVPEMKLPEATVTTVAYYKEEAPSLRDVADALEQNIWSLDRFGSVVRGGYFERVEGPMDREYHVREQVIGSEAEIDSYVQGVMCTPLDHSRPLWTATLLRCAQGRGRSALVLRVHHVISDGLGMLFAFMPMMTCQEGRVADHIPLPKSLLGKAKSSSGGNRSGNAARVNDAPSEPLNGGSGQGSGEGSRGSPRRRGLLATLCLPLRALTGCLRGIFSLLVVKQDSELKMNAPLAQRKPFLPFSGRHRWTRMKPVPMSLIKAVRERHGCTVNDAIMAALAGAIRRYNAEDLKDPLFADAEGAASSQRGRARVECKCTILLALPRPVEPGDPGASLANRILTPMCQLPVGEPTPTARLQRMVQVCNDLKSMAYITGIGLTTRFLSSVAPTGLMQKAASEAISKLTCNVTCLPMATVPTSFMGKELSEVQVLFVNNIPQISLMSYNGQVHWNMVSDPALVPRPEALGEYLTVEMEALARGTE
eukprot:TRINITY_DN9297_c0_g1_i1.p1 TRINITY_DN9297_c0_g1~~TRINITY_DN9297_c0_g1_i1.p1  ORF type:complete len:499 (+),score=98.25 TRINITY_DN9297_c0_g1_i1:88-1584(+)